MKTKSLGLVLLTTFALVLSLALMNASFTVSGDVSLSKSVKSAIITVSNTTSGVSLIVPSTASISDGDGHTLNIALSPNGNNVNLPNSINISYSSLPSNFVLGSFSTPIILANSVNSSDNQSVNIKFRNDYCENGRKERGSEYLEIMNIEDQTSDDQWTWRPGDVVSVDVKVKYKSNDSDDSIDAIIKMELYDVQNNEFVDLGDSDDFEKSVGLDEGTSETETFIIDVPIEDIEASSDRYRLYVKVYEDGEEDTLCEDVEDRDVNKQYKDITIKKESYEIALKNIDITSPTICGEDVTISLTAWNIGKNDEDKVYVKAYNKELGISNLTSDVFSLDEGDSKKISMSFVVPKDVSEKTYDIMLTAFYRYSKSSEEFRDFTEDPYVIQLKVENCQKETRTASITAELSSETPNAIVGKQVAIEATIKNTGSIQSTYTIDISGNTGWSSLAQIDPKTVTLNPGESKKVIIYLDIASDAELGDKEFVIRTASNGIVSEQKVLITVEGGLSGSAILNHLKTNWFIYTIVLINLILIIAIIIVVAKIVRRSSD